MRHPLRAGLAPLLLMGVCLSVTKDIQAHEARPVTVLIKALSDDRYEVRWQVPPSVSADNIPRVALLAKGHCKTLSLPRVIYDPAAFVQTQSWRCNSELETVTLEYPRFNPAITGIIRLDRGSGEVHSTVLGPEKSRWQIPARETKSRVAGNYLSLGIRHILTGYDHLLFLACLLIISATWRRILITITGFTLAHSFTLTLAALGYLRVPVAALEATIALSILFVATEIARESRTTLTWRYPIAVSSSFGLLHGLGFAAALSDAGLPQTEVFAALLFFNLGVETGQMIAIGSALLLLMLLQQFRLQHFRGKDLIALSTKPFAYSVGVSASFLMWQRMASFLH